MSLLARPTEWLGGKGRVAAAVALLVGLVLLATAAAAWEDTLSATDRIVQCAREALPNRACESESPAGAALATLFGPLLAAIGSAVAATGAACLLRPRGRLGAHGQRLLEDAARHHAAGGLSPEGFQATRDRLHAKAATHAGQQIALALSLWGGALAIAAFVLAGGFLDVLRSLTGLDTTGLPATRAGLAATGAATVATLAGATVVLVEAARRRAATRRDASALHRMLADLETDILDEVRRSAPADEDA